jgi:hypothetical protein
MRGKWIIKGSRPQQPMTEAIGMWKELVRESCLSRIGLGNVGQW